MEQKRIQWHPAFCSAMRLELRENRRELRFYNEYNLNSKPLEIDLLVIVMGREVVIRNIIGKFFRKHNIMEYKSEDDELNVDTFFKGQGYCCLYKIMGDADGMISEDEITLSLVRRRKPRKLLLYFEERGYDLTNPFPGIYHVNRGGLFPTQIIVTNELEESEHIWLSSLRRGLKEEGAEQLIFSVKELEERNEKEAGQSVLHAALRANPGIFEGVKEDSMVCEALKELMAPEMEQERKKYRREIRQEVRQELRQELKQRDIQTAQTAFAANLDFDLVSKLLPSLTQEELRKIKESL